MPLDGAVGATASTPVLPKISLKTAGTYCSPKLAPPCDLIPTIKPPYKISQSPMTWKLTTDPIPAPPVSGAFTSTARALYGVKTNG